MYSKRDWGHAKDFIEMQWLMLQQDKPDDYEIATVEQYTVKEYIMAVAKELNMNIKWEGSGLNEKGMDEKNNVIVEVDPRYFRPTEVDSLLGDATKSHSKLGWKQKISFTKLVKDMVTSDLKKAKEEKIILGSKIK